MKVMWVLFWLNAVFAGLNWYFLLFGDTPEISGPVALLNTGTALWILKDL